jgi:hypothetical protein
MLCSVATLLPNNGYTHSQYVYNAQYTIGTIKEPHHMHVHLRLAVTYGCMRVFNNVGDAKN